MGKQNVQAEEAYWREWHQGIMEGVLGFPRTDKFVLRMQTCISACCKFEYCNLIMLLQRTQS